ncbi:MAG TPA: hypothetical protein PLA68_03460 [Panacibacter sp.]|nr:hypothetical protein [Panacibacter sp.]
MKKVLMLMLSVLFIAAIANAQKSDTAKKANVKSKIQDDSPSKEKGTLTPENMKYLGLNKDQEKQVVEMHNKAKKEKQKIKDDTSLSEEQKKEKLKAIDKEYKDKSEAVLTPEQRKKFNDKKKDVKSSNKEKNDQ